MWYVIIPYGKRARSDDFRHAMLSLPLDNTYDQMMSGAACLHGPWEAPTVGLRRAWHAIISLGQHIRWNDVRRGMQSSPLDNIHGQSTSGVAYHRGPWSAHTIGCGLKLSPLDNIHRVGQHRARHAIITFEKYTLSHDIERCMMSYPLDYTHVQMTFVVVMPSSPFECTWSDDIDVECHLPIWTTQIVRRHRARDARMAVGQKTR